MTRPAPMPLYPSEPEIARLVLGARAKDWPALAIILERKGLPKVDPLMGGRCWAKVEKFFAREEGLDAPLAPDSPAPSRIRIRDFAPDGQDNPDAANPQAPHDRRRLGADRRARA